MRRIRIEIDQSLQFTRRLNSAERKFNVSLQASPGAVLNSRADAVLIAGLGSRAKRITRWNGKTYTMTVDGSLFSNAVSIDNSYGNSQFVVGSSLAIPHVPFLFVAGGTKMRKISVTDNIQNWGISPPTSALTPALGGGSGTAIHGRYAYQYWNSTTGHVSNRNTPSANFDSTGQQVTVSGFVASTEVGVTHQYVLRDTNGDGVFKRIGLKGNDTANFTDSLTDANLAAAGFGQVDTNDNGTPPLSDVAAIWRNSVWLVDGTNRRRVWASVPGKLESFSIQGIYDLGEANDEIRAMGVVGGNFYVWTQNRIYLASGEWPLFTFDAISHLGVASAYSISINVDRAVFGMNSGLYEFNGAKFMPLPDIWTLFDPNSTDPRRYTGIVVNDFVVGNDERFIWAGWVKTDNAPVMFEFESFTQKWTERTALSAFDSNHDPFYYIAGDYSNNILELNKGVRGLFILTSPELEMDLSRMLAVELDYEGQSFDVGIYIDGVLITQATVPALTQRGRYTINLPENTVGRQMYFTATRTTAGDVGIADVYLFIDELPLAVQTFDSGEYLLAHNKLLPQELLVHVYAHEQVTINGELFIDGTKVQEFTFSGQGFIGPLRFVPTVQEGRSARVTMKGDGFFNVLLVSLGLTVLGDDVKKRIDLGGEYVAATRQKQRANTPLA